MSIANDVPILVQEPSPFHGPQADRIDRHSHSVQFYGEDSWLIDGLSQTIAATLQAGNTAIVLATAPHRLDLDTRLRQAGLDLESPDIQSRYRTMDASAVLESITTAGSIDRDRFFATVGDLLRQTAPTNGSHTFVFGELVVLLWERGQGDSAIHLEHLWNELSEIHPFALHCAYPMHLFDRPEDSDRLRTICDAHTSVTPTESHTSLQDEGARLRDVTILQHRSQALNTETAQRERAEASLHVREAELADILERALDGIQQVGPDHKIRWANQAMLQLGYTAAEYVGRSLRSIFRYPVEFDEIAGKIMHRQEVTDYPADLLAHDGTIRQVLLHANALWDNDELIYWRCFIRDVTRTVQMEQQLFERNRELAKAVLVRDEFLSVAAHELKTPATTLRAYAQLLQRDLVRKGKVSADRLKSALGAIESQSRKLDQLVVRLLDASQIADGQLRIEPELTDVAALVRGVVDAQRISTRHKISIQGPDYLEITIDPIRFEQVVTNLVNNAVKFSPDGGTVRIEYGKGDDGSLHFAVTDEGVGIVPEERGSVFRRFYQGKDPHRLAGMGLGLHIAREIVALHGGEIRIEQPPHRGTQFIVTLPALI
jgi:PAS domain S-box-containing protein